MVTKSRAMMSRFFYFTICRILSYRVIIQSSKGAAILQGIAKTAGGSCAAIESRLQERKRMRRPGQTAKSVVAVDGAMALFLYALL